MLKPTASINASNISIYTHAGCSCLLPQPSHQGLNVKQNVRVARMMPPPKGPGPGGPMNPPPGPGGPMNPPPPGPLRPQPPPKGPRGPRMLAFNICLHELQIF